MNKVLRKRIPRDLKNSLLRNLALFVMIVLGNKHDRRCGNYNRWH